VPDVHVWVRRHAHLHGRQSRSQLVFYETKETPLTSIIRRTFLLAIAAAPVLHVAAVHAVEALPDARFVGFAETVNDFEIRSGQLALTKSQNELVRGYATRAVAEHTTAAQTLAKNRAEAGVTMAPKISDDAMVRLNSLQGAEFDTAFAAAQLRVQTAAVDQTVPIPRTARAAPAVRARNAPKVAVVSGVCQAVSQRPLDSRAGVATLCTNSRCRAPVADRASTIACFERSGR